MILGPTLYRIHESNFSIAFYSPLISIESASFENYKSSSLTNNVFETDSLMNDELWYEDKCMVCCMLYSGDVNAKYIKSMPDQY